MRSTFSRNASTCSKPSRVAPCVKQSNRHTVRSCGVVSTLTHDTAPSRMKMPSVRVPPTSMSTVSMKTSRLRARYAERGVKIVRGQGPTEKAFHIEDRSLVRCGRASLHRAVSHQNRPIVEEIRVAQRRLDANVGRDPPEK